MLGYRTLCLWRGGIWGPFSSPSAAGGHTGKGPRPLGDSLGTDGWRRGDPFCLLGPSELCSVGLVLLVGCRGAVVVGGRRGGQPRKVPAQRRHTTAGEGEFLGSGGCAAGCPRRWAV